MDFLRKLFGGGSAGGAMSASGGATGDRGLYFYVQPRRCEAIGRVRIDPMNDISEDDEGHYFVRKEVRVIGCPFPAELYVRFSAKRQVLEASVEGGTLVTEADYSAWKQQQGS
ncbi:MAG: hypothetical protein HXY40_10980 [Chloroflexi bacterium]|nr:hypothetical protein [Chloroflexota bacterium]